MIIFRKPVEKIQLLLISDKDNGYFTWRPIYIFIIPRSVLLRMRNFQAKVVEKIKIHILCSVFFAKLCLLWHVEKYCGAGQVTDDSMTHAHCMVDTRSYTHTNRILNTYSFSTSAVVARTRLIVTLYVHCLCLCLCLMCPCIKHHSAQT